MALIVQRGPGAQRLTHARGGGAVLAILATGLAGLGGWRLLTPNHRAIVAEREARGAFETVEALTRVRGICPATVEPLAPDLVPSIRRVVRGSGTGENTATAAPVAPQGRLSSSATR